MKNITRRHRKPQNSAISLINLSHYEELYYDPFVSMSYEVKNAERVIDSSRFFKQLSGKKALDVGFGTGNTLLRLLENGAYAYGTEIAITHNLTWMKTKLYMNKSKNLYLCKADAMNLPYKTNSFDLVICSHVIEHVEDDALLLQEIERVLIPLGIALVIIPINDDSRYHKHKYIFNNLGLLHRGTSLELVEIKGYSFIRFPFKILTFFQKIFFKERKDETRNELKVPIYKGRKLYLYFIVPLLIYISRIEDYIVQLFNTPGQAMIIYQKNKTNKK